MEEITKESMYNYKRDFGDLQLVAGYEPCRETSSEQFILDNLQYFFEPNVLNRKFQSQEDVLFEELLEMLNEMNAEKNCRKLTRCWWSDRFKCC